MREIKFRGKSLDTGKWEEGDLLQYDDGAVCIGVHSKNYTDDGFNAGQYRRIVPVDENTVGEYTGLKDKDGKEIFEGDIVKWENLMKTPMRSAIRYIYNGFRFTDFDGEDQEIWCGVFEAIGNIHDNPELMKGGEL